MQVENNYEKDVFNGDLGTVSEVNEKERSCTVSETRWGMPRPSWEGTLHVARCRIKACNGPSKHANSTRPALSAHLA